MGRRHEKKPVELVLLISVLRGDEVPEMNGVKTTPEKTDLHARTVGGAPSPGKGMFPWPPAHLAIDAPPPLKKVARSVPALVVEW